MGMARSQFPVSLRQAAQKLDHCIGYLAETLPLHPVSSAFDQNPASQVLIPAIHPSFELRS